ncbi:17447_t:CDS:2 [Funneliformis geosporum]|uniref:17447_t:CDS:1 n=1 Tax=Funneliformis geosporum TaxID=1117311 RepID=A0A9W4SNR5_9GLOM|nr:17447_t:CDS:2 [Funneliformis geosporum]
MDDARRKVIIMVYGELYRALAVYVSEIWPNSVILSVTGQIGKKTICPSGAALSDFAKNHRHWTTINKNGLPIIVEDFMKIMCGELNDNEYDGIWITFVRDAIAYRMTFEEKGNGSD